MKLISTRTFYRNKIIPAVALLTILIFYSCSMAPVAVQTAPGEKEDTRKKKIVKVYPDIIKRMIHIKSMEDTTIDFFVFDVHGSMIRYFKMQENDHEKLSGLERGAYVYQVFEKDVMNTSGKIMIR